ncbi:MAG: universal stress protein [Nitrospirota bacterium]
MKKILIAVDDTKGSKNTFQMCGNMCSCMRPDSIILIYVEKFEGRSLIDSMLGDAELSTLRDVLEGTEYKNVLDKKANDILAHYKKTLEDKGMAGIKTVVKTGHPADEILNTAKEENVDMIIVGSRGKRISHAFTGSVSREVVNRADIPVLVVKGK